MTDGDVTCWTLIDDAARGDGAARDSFGQIYLPAVTAYLRRRWTGGVRANDVDDAVQEVFLECFRPGGVLARADRQETRSFRALLLGVTRIVALRHERAGGKARERQQAVTPEQLGALPADDPSLTAAFDKAWALSLMRDARQRLEAQAQSGDEAACQRVEILRLRFEEALPVREIAKQLQADATLVHRAYARARSDFLRCLREAVQAHMPDESANVDEACRRLMGALGAAGE